MDMLYFLDCYDEKRNKNEFINVNEGLRSLFIPRFSVGEIYGKGRGVEFIDEIRNGILHTLSIGFNHSIVRTEYFFYDENNKTIFFPYSKEIYSSDHENYQELLDRIEAYKNMWAGI